MKVRRIAPEDVVGAYVREDLKPMAHFPWNSYYAESATGGCALGALAIDGYFGDVPQTLQEFAPVVIRSLGEIRTNAFTTGFDEGFTDTIGDNSSRLDTYFQWDTEGLYGTPIGRVEILQWYEDGLVAGHSVRRWWKDKQDQNTRRVVYEEVVTAYQQTGIKPCGFSAVHESFTFGVLGCAMGVLAVDRGWVDLQESLKDSQPIWDSFVSYYGWSYTSGLTSGFDCGYTAWSKKHEEEVAEIMDTCESESLRGIQGFKDGLEIGRRLYERGIPSLVPDYPPLTLVKEEVMV